MFYLIQQVRGFWQDSSLKEVPKTYAPDEYAGEAIAWDKWKKEHNKMFDDIKNELNANLNPKSW